MHTRSGRSIGSIATIVTVVLMSIVVAACGYGNESDLTAPPGASNGVPTTAAPTDAASPDVTPDPNLPAQSETEWGTIWNALPPSFPMFDGAKTADPEAGPVSGAFTVANSAADAKAVADFYLGALDAIGYGTGIDGPLEDGSYAVWASSGFGCDSQVTVLPRGDESLVTVLYGAGCPFV